MEPPAEPEVCEPEVGGPEAEQAAFGAAPSNAAHLLDVALGRAQPQFWTDVHGPIDDPPRQRFRVRTGRSRQLVLGAVAAMSVAGAWMLVGRDTTPAAPAAPSDRTPTPTAAARGTSSSPSTIRPGPEAEAGAELAIGIAPAWAPRCRNAPGLAHAGGVAVVCEPTSGPVRIELVLDPQGDRRFDTWVSDPARGRGPARCASGRSEVRTWSQPDDPGVVAGRYACRVADGQAELIWTDAEAGLVARLVGPDDDLASLYRFWSTDAAALLVNRSR